LNPSARRVRLAVALVAAAVLAGLFVLRRAGIDETLFRILAAAGALLVTALFVTYRALLKMVEAARNAPAPPQAGDDP
jgi:hypothetical protein